MSYCRFSSNSFRCDIYAYESDEGFAIHVASFRVPDDAPCERWPQDPADAAEWDRFLVEHNALMDYLETCERRPIGGAHDGASFLEPDLARMRERLATLRAAGYRFPDSVFDAIDAEIAEMRATP